MKIYHLTQKLFVRLKDERCASNQSFNICLALSPEQVARFARKRMWEESSLLAFDGEGTPHDAMPVDKGMPVRVSKEDLPAFCRLIESKVGELLNKGSTHLDAGNWLHLEVVEANRLAECPEEAISGQVLPLRPEDITGDYFSIYDDIYGVRMIHINGYIWNDCDDWRHTECVGILMPLSEFIAGYSAKGQDFTDELFEGAKQYQTDFDSFEQACDTFRNYFDGSRPDARIPYSKLTLDFPEGDFVA